MVFNGVVQVSKITTSSKSANNLIYSKVKTRDDKRLNSLPCSIF